MSEIQAAGYPSSQATPKRSIDDLPIFQQVQTTEDIPVYEVAKITYHTTPNSNPSYRREFVVGITGRSTDSKTIHYCTEWMTGEDGLSSANHSTLGSIQTDDIFRYWILHDKMYRFLAGARINEGVPITSKTATEPHSIGDIVEAK